MTDKAQALIDELVSAAVAFGRGQLPDWQTRIDKAQRELREYIAELEAENERLSQLLHDEMSQLEIATDLGNKRWIALNEIYEKSEKHSAWWCKRKAQEGLGIK